ncbi:MFS transporter [Brevibacterium sp. XM4083]|uniref:MFS transporter n=1 Tax=Brevibacterium sp. XM4083 TaxID=2583238 RepID=UPI0011295FEE|nr:MFS transporter [Brevibacterium sp. XM4083]MCM1011822.1 MFS transporter [Brevibacterium sp. XM4083]
MTDTTTSTRVGRPPSERLPVGSLLALGTAVFITALTETLPAGVLPGMSASLGASEAAVGQTVTIYAIATALTTIPLAILTAKWRRKPLLLVTMALFAVANTVTAFSSDYLLTMIARFAAGVAAGLAWAMIAGYARRMVVPSLQGKAIAVVMTGIPLALGLGVPAGAFLAGLIDWRAAFLAMTVLTLILLLWVLLFVPDQAGTTRDRSTGVRATLATPGVVAVLVVVLLFVLAHTIGYTYIATYLHQVGLGAQVDLVLLAFGLASLVSIWVTGTFIQTHLRALMIFTTVLVGVASTALALVFDNHVLIYVAVIVWGLGWGGVPTLTQTAANDAGGKAADTAQSMLVTLWNLSMALGGIAGGLILAGLGTLSLPWALPVLLLPTLIVVLASRHGFPRYRAVAETEPTD